jgi:hypothetical protein
LLFLLLAIIRWAAGIRAGWLDGVLIVPLRSVFTLAVFAKLLTELTCRTLKAPCSS